MPALNTSSASRMRPPSAPARAMAANTYLHSSENLLLSGAGRLGNTASMAGMIAMFTMAFGGIGTLFGNIPGMTPVARLMKSPSQRMEHVMLPGAVRGTVASGMSGVSTWIGNTVGNLHEKSAWLANHAANAQARNAQMAQEMCGPLTAQFGKISTTLAGNGHLQQEMGAIRQLLSSPDALVGNMGTFRSAVANAHKKIMANATTPEAKKLALTVRDDLRDLTRAATEVEQYAFRSKDVSTRAALAPKRASEMSLSTGLNVAMIGGSALAQGVSHVRSIKDGIKVMKEMVAAIEGKKPQDISTWRVLFGSMPAAVKDVRSQFRKVMVSRLFGTAFWLSGTTILQRRFGNVGGYIGLGAQFALDPMNQYVESQNGAIDAYFNFSRIHTAVAQSGQQPDADATKQMVEACAAMIGFCSPTARKNGGIDNKAVHAMAKDCVAAGYTPAQIMKMIKDGELAPSKVAAPAPTATPAVLEIPAAHHPAHNFAPGHWVNATSRASGPQFGVPSSPAPVIPGATR